MEDHSNWKENRYIFFESKRVGSHRLLTVTMLLLSQKTIWTHVTVVLYPLSVQKRSNIIIFILLGGNTLKLGVKLQLESNATQIDRFFASGSYIICLISSIFRRKIIHLWRLLRFHVTLCYVRVSTYSVKTKITKSLISFVISTVCRLLWYHNSL